MMNAALVLCFLLYAAPANAQSRALNVVVRDLSQTAADLEAIVRAKALAVGDRERRASRYKEAVAHYRDALSKTEGL
jgi:hypothetical protein